MLAWDHSYTNSRPSRLQPKAYVFRQLSNGLKMDHQQRTPMGAMGFAFDDMWVCVQTCSWATLPAKYWGNLVTA